MPSKKFSGLLTEPKPIPDDDGDGPGLESPEAQPAPQAQPATPQSAARSRRPQPSDPAQLTPAPTSATPAGADTPPASRTIRLHASAAEPLNAAWLNERRTTNPKLSYPEFASMIVNLGLAAYEKRKARSA